MTMNGRADIVGPPITLGDFLPERREVVLNGEKYLAWVVTNRRYPRDIMVKLDRSMRKYVRALDAATKEGADEDAIDAVPQAWNDHVTEVIMLLVPTTLESELQLVDIDVLHKLGQDLGYFPPNADDGAEEEAPAEVTEAVTPESPLTGASSPESSVVSTPATELTSS